MTDFEFLTDVRAFLLTYPYLAPYQDLLIDYEQIIEMQNSDRFGAGAALLLAGDSIVSKIENKNVIGETMKPVIHNKRINFALIMWRDSNDDEFRRDIGNSLTQLIKWVNDENYKRGTPDENPKLPKFSMTDIESISATGGIPTAVLDRGRREYQISIHCDYQIVYM